MLRVDVTQRLAATKKDKPLRAARGERRSSSATLSQLWERMMMTRAASLAGASREPARTARRHEDCARGRACVEIVAMMEVPMATTPTYDWEEV